MMSYFQAILFGLLQGVTELFPISSLGHSVILPQLLGWKIDQKGPFFLTFLVATHTATATVLLAFFWKDWVKIIGGVLKSLRDRELAADNSYGKVGWLLVAGTIPAGILGVLFEQQFKDLFANARLVAGVLILNGLLLYGAEILRRRQAKNSQKLKETTMAGSDQRIAKLSWFKAIQVGLLQCIALVPGFSRTGSTITGGLLVGLSHEDAARFSFLLATPIIAAASLLKLPELSGATSDILGPIVIGSISAGIGAFLSVKFLTKYFETEKLSPFAIYCMIAGASVLGYLLISGR